MGVISGGLEQLLHANSDCAGVKLERFGAGRMLPKGIRNNFKVPNAWPLAESFSGGGREACGPGGLDG